MQDKDKYVAEVLRRLSARYGSNPRTKLFHANMRELFVAALLSPQSTDAQVNRAIGPLFRKYCSFEDYARADVRRLQKDLKSVNFFRTKARNLKKASGIILKRFNGKVPRTMAEITELPGVGRKVGNVILNEGYAINEGIAVDTHAGRVARRIGLSRSRDANKVEQDLLRKIPAKDWGRASNLLIELGRDACKARKKECYRCALNDICPSSDIRRKARIRPARINYAAAGSTM